MVRPSPPPRPDDLGPFARVYLEHFGLVASSQPIRSSDWNIVCGDPFAYYLSRRLSLKSSVRVVKALSAGSWVHTAMEHHADPKREAKLAKLWDDFCKNLRDLGRVNNIHGDTINTMIEEEERYRACGLGWWDVVSRLPLPNGHRLEQMFDPQATTRVVAQEKIVRLSGAYLGVASDVVIQVDKVIVNTANKSIWPADLKSTSWPTIERLSLCPIEFQTQLYTNVFLVLEEAGKLGDHIPELKPYLAEGYTVGGMLHFAFQKPTIEFCDKDKPYRWISDGKKKGIFGTIKPHEIEPRQLQLHLLKKNSPWQVLPEGYHSEADAVAALHEICGKIPTKEYEGEPDIRLYIARCEDWFLGRGEYENLADERRASPIVNFSVVKKELLQTKAMIDCFNQRMQLIDHYATCEANPNNFPMHGNPTGYQTKPSASPYFPFYTLPAVDWPNVVRAKHLVQDPRDLPSNIKENKKAISS